MKISCIFSYFKNPKSNSCVFIPISRTLDSKSCVFIPISGILELKSCVFIPISRTLDPISRIESKSKMQPHLRNHIC